MNTLPPQPRPQPLPLLLGALCTAMSFAAMAAPATGTAPAPTLRAYIAPSKPARTLLGKHDSREFIEVKFAQNKPVRLRNGRLNSPTLKAGSITQLENVLSQHVVANIEPLFHVANETALQQLSATAQQRSGRVQSDLNQWYRIRVQPGADVVTLTNQLNALDSVEIAYPAPLAAPPPSASAAPRTARYYPTFASPDHTALQGYAKPASAGGIDAMYARTLPGGNGANVRVVDIEYSWNMQHEDLSQLRASNALISNGTPTDPFNDINHGTAVIGEIAADVNPFGVTGLVPNVKVHVANVHNSERGYDLANTIIAVTQVISPGDVILIEQQTGNPGNCTYGYAPVEVIPSYYDAIVTAVSKGIHVVEAGGNGTANLDDTCYGSPFPGGRPDSGAIMVGGGSTPGCTSPTRTRLWCTNFGARVNVQGWGECVVSTGYGDLSGTTANDHYTKEFDGTSSSSPVVASAVAALSGVAKQRGITLTPLQLRQKLIDTGTPQSSPADKIGPLPNLRAAIDSLTGGSNQLPVAGFGFTTNGLTATFTDSSSDVDGSIVARSWNFGDGTSNTATSPSKTYTAAGTYTVILTVTDNAGGVDTETKTVTVSSGGQTYSNTTDVAINDKTTVESPISVAGRVGNAPNTAKVAVNIVHTYIGDLKVDLIAPSGTVYPLHNRGGGSTNNINHTYTLDLSKQPLDGTWKLRVADNGIGDIGRIDSWSITF